MTGRTNGSLGANGGIGLQNTISGIATYYAGGGGGGVYDNSSGGVGGNGGGGNGGGGSSGNATAGATNKGGGGGGGSYNGAGGAGGSGLVILKYPSSYTATFSVGLTSSTITSAGYKISTVTAGTGTVTFTS